MTSASPELKINVSLSKLSKCVGASPIASNKNPVKQQSKQNHSDTLTKPRQQDMTAVNEKTPAHDKNVTSASSTPTNKGDDGNPSTATSSTPTNSKHKDGAVDSKLQQASLSPRNTNGAYDMVKLQV